MIVGDSITQGSSGDYTWQYRLYEHLRAVGVRARMVGPHHWLFNNVTNVEGDRSYADPGFEHANDASWGMTLFREKDAIGAKVATYRPDYLLVLLGLDDIFWYGVSQSEMAANLAGFIVAARAARSHIRIVLGLIPPDIHQQTDPAFAASIASYNHTISSTASQLSTRASPIAVARDGTGIKVAADLWDGTHPNANGEIKIAAAFADILAGRFHLGSAYPTPFPVLPTGPLTQPRLTVTPSGTAGQAKLSWTLVPGAESYQVYVKDVTRGETRFRHLPWPLSPAQNPWTAGLLTAGDTYAFQLQACKGADCGAFSNVASIATPWLIFPTPARSSPRGDRRVRRGHQITGETALAARSPAFRPAPP
jgi:GDSL-like Lipase/Acylhydrolase family